MFLESVAQRVLLALMAVFLAVTTVKDWFDFYTCGVVGQCLADAGTLQFFTKFFMSLLLTVMAFIVSRDAFSRRDGRLLRVAFVFSFLADTSFSVIKLVVPSERALSDVLGIALFLVFQTLLIYRHSRKSDSDTSRPSGHLFLCGLLGAAAGVFGGGVLEFTLGNVTIVTVAVYGVFLTMSMVVGILAPRRGYFPAKNALCIRWGMVAFFIGDVLVGLSLLSGEDHGALQTASAISKNFIWWFYVPAQLMIIRACQKPKA